jgi:hypothetical protein
VASAGPAFPADEPISGPSLAPVDESLIPALPELPWVWQGPDLALELVQSQPFSSEDKGATYTAMGREESPLTEREKALLELSRAAVEASRLAGTLQLPLAEAAGPTVSRAEAERLKEESLHRSRAVEPVPGTGDPADQTDRQAAGRLRSSSPLEPTPAELERLAAARGQSGVVVLDPPETPVREEAGAPRRGSSNVGVGNTEPPAKGK